MSEAEAVAGRLERVFEAIRRERMADLPIVNPALGVHAIGTQAFGETWLSLLVTPWCINVMLLPRDEAVAEGWATLQLGAAVGHVLPAGGFQFIVGEEAGLGRFQMCSLFSPVLEFEDDAAAVATAEAALEALFAAPEAAEPSEEARFMGALSEGRLPEELVEPAPAEPEATESPTPSRREMLTGSVSGRGAETG